MALEDTLYTPSGTRWLTGLVAAVDTTKHELTITYAGGTVPNVRYLRGQSWTVGDIVECLSDEIRGIIAIGSPYPRTGSAPAWNWTPRTYVSDLLIAGPWPPPASWGFTVPFKADILVVSTLSFWANNTGMTGFQPWLDGVAVGSWWDLYFNQTAVHTTVGNAFTLRNVAPGNHTWTISMVIGNGQSDGNDRGHIGMTMVEVP